MRAAEQAIFSRIHSDGTSLGARSWGGGGGGGKASRSRPSAHHVALLPSLARQAQEELSVTPLAQFLLQSSGHTPKDAGAEAAAYWQQPPEQAPGNLPDTSAPGEPAPAGPAGRVPETPLTAFLGCAPPTG